MSLGFSKIAFACPMCADLIERGRGAFRMMGFAKGISTSIGILLIVPLSILIGIGIFLYTQRKTEK